MSFSLSSTPLLSPVISAFSSVIPAPLSVIPAKAGIHGSGSSVASGWAGERRTMDSRFRGSDGGGKVRTTKDTLQ